MSKDGVLLVNLGSPDSTSVGDVRRYLREFLSDDRVLDKPKIIQQLILNLFILPTRPAKSAAAYAKIWTDEGSPLVLSTLRLRDLLLERSDRLPIAVGMRYGNPSTEAGIKELLDQGVERIYMVPLYPHYAKSSFETAVVKAREVLTQLSPKTELFVEPPFFDHEAYIEALAKTTAEQLEGYDYDMLLFSYHGIPERHLRQADPSHAYCLTDANCCEKKDAIHATCYRAQCFATTRALTERLGLERERWHVSFQSRLLKEPWLSPYTDFELAAFPDRGVKKIAVICPSFVSDCLETLEEIAMEGKHDFLESGGEEFKYITCVNEHEAWLDALEGFIENFENGGLSA